MRKTLIATISAVALLAAACGSEETTGLAATAGAETAGAETDDAATGSTDGDSTTPEDLGSPDDGSADPGESDDDGDSAVQPTGDRTQETPTAAADRGTLRAALLDEALDQSGTVSSARFEGRVTMVGKPGSELPGEVSMVFSGAYDLAADASQVSMDLSGLVEAAMAAEGEDQAEMAMFAGLFDSPLEAITIGETSWIKWGLISMFTGTEDMWLEGAADEAGDLTSGFGVGNAGSPVDLLETLADADATIEQIGTEELRGTTTTHYRATVDAEAFADSMSPEERADFEADLGAMPVPALPIELWLDDDGNLHRFVLDLSAGGALEGDDEFDSMTLVFDLWDHGQDLGIVPPPADQVIDEADSLFGFEDLGDFGA